MNAQWTQLLIGLVPLLVAVLMYRQSVKVQRINSATTERAAEQTAELEKSKVDAAAYERAKLLYESALSQLEKQLERLQAQLDRVQTQLTQEQETSHTLRNQVHELRRQLTELERILGEFRRELVRAGVDPTVMPQWVRAREQEG